MAWCTNPACGKDGLRKADIEFCEDTRMILCHGCYALRHPGWEPPLEVVDLSEAVPVVKHRKPKVGFAIQMSEFEGLKAQVSYGGATFTIQAPPGDLKRIIGG